MYTLVSCTRFFLPPLFAMVCNGNKRILSNCCMALKEASQQASVCPHIITLNGKYLAFVHT